MYCIVLYCIVLYCIVLYCIVWFLYWRHNYPMLLVVTRKQVQKKGVHWFHGDLIGALIWEIPYSFTCNCSLRTQIFSKISEGLGQLFKKHVYWKSLLLAAQVNIMLKRLIDTQHYKHHKRKESLVLGQKDQGTNDRLSTCFWAAL